MGSEYVFWSGGPGSFPSLRITFWLLLCWTQIATLSKGVPTLWGTPGTILKTSHLLIDDILVKWGDLIVSFDLAAVQWLYNTTLRVSRPIAHTHIWKSCLSNSFLLQTSSKLSKYQSISWHRSKIIQYGSSYGVQLLFTLHRHYGLTISVISSANTNLCLYTSVWPII